MKAQSEPDGPVDLADRVEGALRALWEGDGTQVDELLDATEAPGPSMRELFHELTAALAPPAALAHDAVPGYEIVRELGRGGMGVVYEAVQEETNRTVALKVMLAGPFASSSARARFRREVELAARLQHSHIVRILEGGHLSSGLPYYSMDLVRGTTLGRHLAAAHPDTREIVKLFIQLCDAVDYAHQHGVVHRDLKPGNVLVDQDGQPHIVDFGLAKALDAVLLDTLAASSPEQIVGTLRYLSPEQAAGKLPAVDGRTDEYALAAMLFEALTGELPYETCGHPSSTLQRIVSEPPRRPSSLAPQVDHDLETVLLKALEKEPDRRYQSVGKLGDDLLRWLNGEPIVARPASAVYRLRKRLLRNRRGVALAACVIAVIGVGLVGELWWRSRTEHHRLARELAVARSRAMRIQSGIEAGRLEEALASASALYGQHPDVPEARLVFAQAQFRHGRRYDIPKYESGGIALLQEAPLDDPYRWVYDSLLAEFYRATGAADADIVQERANRAAPDSAGAWYLRSLATMNAEAARSYAEKALERDPDHKGAWGRLAYLRMETGDFAGALRLAQKLVDRESNVSEWAEFRGHVLLRARRYQEAVDQYARLLATAPDNPSAWRSRALANLCLRNYEQAVADYSEAVRRAPETPYNLYMRATPLWIVGRTEDAAEDYRRFRNSMRLATCADARLFLVLRDWARQAEQGEKTDEASRLRTEADDALAQGRSGAAAGSWLAGVLACLAGELAPDELVARANRRDSERECEAYYYAGEACLLCGLRSEAHDWFQKCVATDVVLDQDSYPPDPMNEWHLARWRLSELADRQNATP